MIALQVKEQGQTKVLLTADSNLIEVHELKKAYEKAGPSYPGRGRGRGRGRDALTRFFDREDRLMGVGGGQSVPAPQPPEPQQDFGDGWFIWRAWRVNQPFMDNFNKHIERLVDKHRAAIEREQSRVDNRIAALLKEKELNSDPGLQRIIDFFAEVFVKYLYMKTNFAALKVEQIINILRQFYSLENTEFASQIRVVMQQQQTLLQKQQQTLQPQQQQPQTEAAGHYQQQPQSPSQPLNLSLAATDVPLPPSPTSPPPREESYPNLPSVQSINPGTPARHGNTVPVPKVNESRIIKCLITLFMTRSW